MWTEIFIFEIKYHLKQPLFYFAALVLALFGLLLISTNAGVDIFPRERRLEISGSYHLRNKTAAPIETLHVSIDPAVVINNIDLGGHREVLVDPELGYYIYELADPIPPAGSMEFDFDLTVKNQGFVNNDSNTQIVYNGTFFNNRRFFPSLGYNAGSELVDPNKRRKYGLPPIPRMAKVDDLSARGDNYITNDSDWINFEAICPRSSGSTPSSPRRRCSTISRS